MRAIRPRGLAIALGLAASLACASQASAAMSYNFTNISSNTDGNAIQTQLTMKVYGNADGQVFINGSPVTPSATQVLFVFTNAVGIASNITEIYFQNGDGIPIGGPASPTTVFNQGTSFTFGSASPGDLPNGNSLNPDFAATSGLVSEGDSNGVNAASDAVGILLDLASGQSYDTVKAALANGLTPASVWNSDGSPISGALGLRVGLHVRSINPGGGSAAYINGSGTDFSTVVPEPSTIAMLVSGLVPLGLIGVRRALGGRRASR